MVLAVATHVAAVTAAEMHAASRVASRIKSRAPNMRRGRWNVPMAAAASADGAAPSIKPPAARAATAACSTATVATIAAPATGEGRTIAHRAVRRIGAAPVIATRKDT